MKILIASSVLIVVLTYGFGFQVYYAPKWESGACQRTDVLIVNDDVYVPMGDDFVNDYKKSNSSVLALVYYPLLKWYENKYMVLSVE